MKKAKMMVGFGWEPSNTVVTGLPRQDCSRQSKFSFSSAIAGVSQLFCELMETETRGSNRFSCRVSALQSDFAEILDLVVKGSAKFLILLEAAQLIAPAKIPCLYVRKIVQPEFVFHEMKLCNLSIKGFLE